MVGHSRIEQAPVQVIRMLGAFVFKGRTYPDGSYMVLSTPRRALTADEYQREFGSRSAHDF